MRQKRDLKSLVRQGMVFFFVVTASAVYQGAGISVGERKYMDKQQACDIFVDGRASPANGCGSRALPCSTIRDGVKVAQLNKKKRLCVQAGVRYENECKETTIITQSLEIVAVDFISSKLNTIAGNMQALENPCWVNPLSAFPPSFAVVDCGSVSKARPFQFATNSAESLSFSHLGFTNIDSRVGGSALFASGGSIVIKHCHFQNLSTIQDTGGGAIWSSNATVVRLLNSTFCQCSALKGSGGAVLLSPVANGTGSLHYEISGSSFKGCAAGVAGGGISFKTHSSTSNGLDVAVTSSSFTSNSVHGEVRSITARILFLSDWFSLIGCGAECRPVLCRWCNKC